MIAGEVDLLRQIVTNNWGSDGLECQLARKAHPFLQGHTVPTSRGHGNDGWALVEFWTDDTKAIDAWIAHVESQFLDHHF